MMSMVTANTCIVEVKVPELFNCGVLVSRGVWSDRYQKQRLCQQRSANHGTFRAVRLPDWLAERLAIGSFGELQAGGRGKAAKNGRWPIRSSSGRAVAGRRPSLDYLTILFATPLHLSIEYINK